MGQDDRAFLDEVYQLWANTTGAKGRFWMPVEYEDRSGRYKVYAVSFENSEDKKLVADSVSDWDAEFICGLHGVVPDLVRLAQDALDEAERADYDHDSRECRIAELEMEVDELKQIVNNLSQDPPWHQRG